MWSYLGNMKNIRWLSTLTTHHVWRVKFWPGYLIVASVRIVWLTRRLVITSFLSTVYSYANRCDAGLSDAEKSGQRPYHDDDDLLRLAARGWITTQYIHAVKENCAYRLSTFTQSRLQVALEVLKWIRCERVLDSFSAEYFFSNSQGWNTHNATK